MLFDIVALKKDGKYLLRTVLIPVSSYSALKPSDQKGWSLHQSLKVSCGVAEAFLTAACIITVQKLLRRRKSQPSHLLCSCSWRSGGVG